MRYQIIHLIGTPLALILSFDVIKSLTQTIRYQLAEKQRQLQQHIQCMTQNSMHIMNFISICSSKINEQNTHERASPSNHKQSSDLFRRVYAEMSVLFWGSF